MKSKAGHWSGSKWVTDCKLPVY
ncbi:hypothetical protein [Methanosarcina mazei]